MAPRHPQADADTRSRILSAAGEVFAAIGLEGARVDDIAQRAGVNKAMLYYHVGDKQRLYEVVLIDTIDRALTSFRAAIANLASPSAKLQALLDVIASLGAENPNFVPMIVREVSTGGAHLPDEMLLRMAAVFRIVGDILQEGVSRRVFRKTDPLLTHVSLVGSMMFLVATQPIRERLRKIAGLPAVSHTPADLARHAGSLFLRGLESSPARSTKPAPAQSRAKKRVTS